MEKVFPEEGKKFKPISDCSRLIVQGQGNVEAFELRELSNKVQCEHSHKDMISGHV